MVSDLVLSTLIGTIITSATTLIALLVTTLITLRQMQQKHSDVVQRLGYQATQNTDLQCHIYNRLEKLEASFNTHGRKT